MSIPEYRAKYDSMSDGEQSSEQVSVAGRVMNYRASSAKLIFLDLVGDGEKIQVGQNHDSKNSRISSFHDTTPTGSSQVLDARLSIVSCFIR